MDIASLIAFNLVLAAAIASPGPAMLYSIRTTLVSGRASGIAAGFGLGLMATAWLVLAMAGLDAVFALFPQLYLVMKTIGAIYLIWIAWQTWLGAHKPVEAAARPHASAFLGGVLLNLANPKSVLFAAAVIVVIFPQGLSLGEMAILAADQFIVEVIFYATLAMLMSSRAVSERYMRAKPALDRAAAMVLGGLGLKLLADR